MYVFMDEPLAPYALGKEGEVCKEGITKEIFDELFERLGMRYEIRLVPWARAIDCVQHRECDGIPLLIKNKERESFLKYSEPVVENRELLYFLPERLGAFKWDKLEELKNYNIGLIRGYTYASSLLEAIEKHDIHVTYAKDSKMNFRMLQAGRVDLIVEDESVAKPLLNAQPEWAKRIRPAAKTISSYYWRIGVSHRSPLAKHMDAINQALDAIRIDGSLARILDKR